MLKIIDGFGASFCLVDITLFILCISLTFMPYFSSSSNLSLSLSLNSFLPLFLSYGWSSSEFCPHFFFSLSVLFLQKDDQSREASGLNTKQTQTGISNLTVHTLAFIIFPHSSLRNVLVLFITFSFSSSITLNSPSSFTISIQSVTRSCPFCLLHILNCLPTLYPLYLPGFRNSLAVICIIQLIS